MNSLSSLLSTGVAGVATPANADPKKQTGVKVVPSTRPLVSADGKRASFVDYTDSSSDDELVQKEEGQTEAENEIDSYIREGEEFLARSTSVQKPKPPLFSFKAIRQTARAALGIPKKGQQVPVSTASLAEHVTEKSNTPTSVANIDLESTDKESLSVNQSDRTSVSSTISEVPAEALLEKDEVLLRLSNAEQGVERAKENLETAAKRLERASELIQENERNPNVKKAKLKAPVFLQEQAQAEANYRAKFIALRRAEELLTSAQKTAQIMSAKANLMEAEAAYLKAREVASKTLRTQKTKYDKALLHEAKAYGAFRLATREHDAAMRSLGSGYQS